MKRIIIPLPSYGFDPTESAIPWLMLTANGVEVTFATPEGEKAKCDQLMLRGKKLGIWKPILKARKDAVDAYLKMEKDSSFENCISYSEALESDYDGIVLPGGHDKGMIEYLESPVLQKLVVAFFNAEKPVGAICHGVVLLARSIDPKTNQSVINNRKVTALLKSQEMAAYNMTRLWLKDYYLTYPGLTVEDEVKSILASELNFLKGSTPIFRDSEKKLSHGFSVRDENLVTARWPGDAYNFSFAFMDLFKDY